MSRAPIEILLAEHIGGRVGLIQEDGNGDRRRRDVDGGQTQRQL